ncbi:hypothetical protein ANN_14275 [Periplaneta americana]|uniref:Uncharacterized protein n=1 Tax=Periplaneta americana TaxID=6978 RepID=A0ABQ8SX31_PERAM|nr:hypothetical protein ANN_14275 [Periplaneta americana]
MLGENPQTIRENTGILLEASEKIGLAVNPEKTKYMIMSRDQNIVRNGNIKIGDLSFEEVEKFKYLGATVTNINDTREEIKRRINMGNACYYSIEKLLSSSLLSKNFTAVEQIQLLGRHFSQICLQLTFVFGDHIKSIVYERPIDKAEELVARIVLAFDDLRNRPQIFRRIRRSVVRHRSTGGLPKLLALSTGLRELYSCDDGYLLQRNPGQNFSGEDFRLGPRRRERQGEEGEDKEKKGNTRKRGEDKEKKEKTRRRRGRQGESGEDKEKKEKRRRKREDKEKKGKTRGRQGEEGEDKEKKRTRRGRRRTGRQGEEREDKEKGKTKRREGEGGLDKKKEKQTRRRGTQGEGEHKEEGKTRRRKRRGEGEDKEKKEKRRRRAREEEEGEDKEKKGKTRRRRGKTKRIQG